MKIERGQAKLSFYLFIGSYLVTDSLNTKIFNRFLFAYRKPSMMIQNATGMQEPLVSMNDLYSVYFLNGRRQIYQMQIYSTSCYNL